MRNRKYEGTRRSIRNNDFYVLDCFKEIDDLKNNAFKFEKTSVLYNAPHSNEFKDAYSIKYAGEDENVQVLLDHWQSITKSIDKYLVKQIGKPIVNTSIPPNYRCPSILKNVDSIRVYLGASGSSWKEHLSSLTKKIDRYFTYTSDGYNGPDFYQINSLLTRFLQQQGTSWLGLILIQKQPHLIELINHSQSIPSAFLKECSASQKSEQNSLMTQNDEGRYFFKNVEKQIELVREIAVDLLFQSTKDPGNAQEFTLRRFNPVRRVKASYLKNEDGELKSELIGLPLNGIWCFGKKKPDVTGPRVDKDDAYKRNTDQNLLIVLDGLQILLNKNE